MQILKIILSLLFQALQSYDKDVYANLKAASTPTPVLRLFKLAPKNEINIYGGSGGCSLQVRQESFPVRFSPSKMTNETLSQRSKRLSGSRVASWQSSKVAKKFALSEGGACSSSCLPNTAIQRLQLLGEHVVMMFDDARAVAVHVCGRGQFLRFSKVTLH